MLTQEVSDVDRLLIISELEQVIQSLVTDQTINVEFDIEDNGNEKVITITTTSTLPGIVEEEPTEEAEEEESNDNGDDSSKEPEEPSPPADPPEDPVEPEPPVELPQVPPFG